MSEEKDNLFKPVGEAAEEVSEGQMLPNGVKLTGAEDAMGHPVQEIESLCMNCHENGTTRMLLTSIPYFREVVIMSFECPHCGFKNSEIQPASSIQEKGSKYTLKVENKDDFNRQVIKSETASCKFIELDIEIPPKRGVLTTVEGLLEEMIEDLQSDQEMRKKIDEAMHDKIDAFIKKVRATIDCTPEGVNPVTFELDDASGNSWIEYKPGEAQHKWSHSEYVRTDEQNVQIGMLTQDQYEERRKAKLAEVADHERNPSEAQKLESNFLSDETDIENFSNEVQTFTATCPSCMEKCDTHMKPVNIPHFKEVIIMSTSCEHCGYKSNEVKTGGAIPEKGRKITLLCDDPSDLSRDILKSESCSLVVKELSLDIQEGTLGGRFTTIEGLLTQVYEELEARIFSQTSDSMDETVKNRWIAFFAKLKEAIAGKVKFTIEMTDPLAGSYIQNVYAPDPDPNMKIEDYERTAAQNEELGLSEMKV
ncbi:similar to Saccharomyces cerevisiae YGR211W ZPR1 Essential protein with two zinc fingers [Maudiozyma saulgeensis]|uniref:Similar to Saccharomyces cerevisiae YGR211W ZPR1 Essential protein with two zinc fingers n=1 Tax=Maudiozyma saulgeensis TaxID=1789683 RepID=A0A1X7QWX3_9SACH|nr:similar to Saccharomyces cerevisiae YGR211W ZPR1 Essential protein with two zinc fingers [Kazachstania saulgeensis]